MNKQQEASFKKFVIKYTVVASVLTWLISAHMKEFIDKLIDSIVEPLFSIDLDENGEPDVQQAKKMITDFLGFKFPIGKIILAIVKTIMYMTIIYLSVIFIFRYTNLLK